MEALPTPVSRVLAMDGVRSWMQSRWAVRMAMRAVNSLTLKSSYHICPCLSVPWTEAPDPGHTQKAIRLLWAHMLQCNKLDDFGLHISTSIFKRRCCKTGSFINANIFNFTFNNIRQILTGIMESRHPFLVQKEGIGIVKSNINLRRMKRVKWRV